MTDRAQISLKVDPDTKAEWQEEAENNPDYSSLTHLIRRAVDREINGETNGKQSNGSSPGGKEIDRLNETLQNFREDMGELRGEIREMKGEMRRVVPDTDARMDIYGELPLIEVSDYDPHDPQDTPTDLLERGVTVEELSERLPAYDKQTIRNHLRDMAEDTGQIGTAWVPENGTTHYFKER